ncbi:hypothetical protein UFVDC4_00164 [Staphylococcus phage vB_SauM-UFV_DC4]|nr:hypothetical protein UFVDC4_00164 [Staphylococcus phage vB_SauM-UFV_DC4]
MSNLTMQEKDLIMIENKYNRFLDKKEKIMNKESDFIKIAFEELMDFVVHFGHNKFFKSDTIFYREYDEMLENYKMELNKISKVEDDLVLTYLNKIINDTDKVEFYNNMKKISESYSKEKLIVSISYIKALDFYIHMMRNEELMSDMGSLTVHPYDFNKRLISEYKKDNIFWRKLSDEEKSNAIQMSNIYFEGIENKEIGRFTTEHINSEKEGTVFNFNINTFHKFFDQFVSLDIAYTDGLIFNLMMNSNISKYYEKYYKEIEHDIFNASYISDKYDYENLEEDKFLKILNRIDMFYNVNIPLYIYNSGETSNKKYYNYLTAMKSFALNDLVNRYYDSYEYIEYFSEVSVNDSFTLDMLSDDDESESNYFGELNKKIKKENEERQWLQAF